MFEQVSPQLLARAQQPALHYGREILAETLSQQLSARAAHRAIILTQPEAWACAQAQFAPLAGPDLTVIYLKSLEYAELKALEQELPGAELIMGLGGGQALDVAKFVAWRRDLPLILAPTIVSVDAAVTNTIAVREGRRVRYIGFVVADAIPVDLAVISQAPPSLNRAGVGDLLSIHTALWDWQQAGTDYDPASAAQAQAILAALDARAESLAACSDEALSFVMESYACENTLCLQVGSSRPEEGSEHYLGYNLEYLTNRGYVHGQLICLCTYALARLQENRPHWVRSLIERTRCPWRLSELGIANDIFIQALLTLPAYARAEAFPDSVITLRAISPALAAQIAAECA